MVAAKALVQGMRVTVTSGPYKGATATVIDPTVFPDGHPDQRKLRIDIEGVGETLIIPKQLTITGMTPTVASYTPAPVRASVPTVAVSKTPITSLDDPMLDRWRPTNRPKILKEYVSRELQGGFSDIEVMMKYLHEDRVNGYPPNIGLVGDTQSGKTMLVEVMAYLIADEMGLKKPLPVFLLAGNSAITDHDMFGQYRPDETGELVWMEGVVALAARIGGILYLDEINAMPGNVTAALHPLADDRRQFVNIRKPVDDGHGGKMAEVVTASTDLWIISTYNPGYAGMSKTNEAFAARFRWLSWDYDEEVEKKLIKSPAVRLLGQALRTARDTRAISTPIGTSSLQRLERDVVMFSVEYALWAFCGQFTNRAERTVVETLIEDRSIRAMLLTEVEGTVTPSPSTH
jgi:hypothetical protein